MLEEEHKLQKRQQRFNQKMDLVLQADQDLKNQTTQMNKSISIKENSNNEQSKLKEGFDETSINPESNVTTEQQLFNKLLDPRLFEALESMDIEKMKQISAAESASTNDPTNATQANLLEKAGSLREIVRDLHKADKAQLEKGMSFLQNMGKLFSNAASMNNDPNDPEAQKLMTTRFNDQLTQGLSSFAEDLLKNDGNSFINMMESLSESRTAREELLRENIPKQLQQQPHPHSISPVSSHPWEDEDDDEHVCHHHHHHHDDDDEYDDDEEEYDDEDDEDDEDEDDDDDDELDDDDEEGASDTESEISEEEKMQEVRRLFLIQVIKLFQERLKNAYKEKLSQDRTQKLIEELEAEEQAKKERELKKLKQKEKAKEKKRLQQLAKEEERKKKEDEERAKEEELRLKQEALRAEQRRRKEEARLKREEEKKKRIEELKRKEEEHKKKVEAQRKREEESKRLKEERRKKAEEERKQKEEEKKQKELLRKQKEEERERMKLEREKQLAEEKAKQEQEEQERAAAMELAKQKQLEEEEASKNHLLNQLYQAKPGGGSTISSGQSSNISTATVPAISPLDSTTISGSGPPIPQVVPQYVPSGPVDPFNNAFSSNNLLSQGLTSPPVTTNNLVTGLSGNLSANLGGVVNPTSTPSPWASKSRLSSLSNPAASQPLFQQPPPMGPLPPTSATAGTATTTNFSPFFNDPLSQDAYLPTTLNATTNLWNSSTSTVVTPTTGPTSATTRTNSIWGNGPGNGLGSVAETPVVPMNPGGSSAATGGLWNSNPNTPTTSGPGLSTNDIDLIQATTFSSFQMLQNSNQLEYGYAPVAKLFNNVKSILNYPGLTLAQVFSCWCPNAIYKFEFVWDESGNVSHVQVGLTGFTRTSPPPPPLPQQQPPQQQQQQQSVVPPPGLSKTSPLFNEGSLLSNIGNLSSGSLQTTGIGNVGGSNGGFGSQLALWDTAGQEEYERLRPLSYFNSHVILIAFSIDEPDSLDNARTKWIHEVKKYCPDTPYLLCGLKKDLRTDLNDRKRFVQYDMGEAMAYEVGAKKYLESSALTGEGVDDIFEFATRTSLLYNEKERTGCCRIL
ncbi:uncharacterized protein J8A68_005010 [[Candida] subhashii]|uniref:Uncharacterized protein n=1 Tax=[Candida] subhashii TaxID=561895 RepID=A0A8J5QHY0_9ASCO|nr:uncharacterized protein J8A68_005010 [[Candida] subhashii]KAG7661432.1 hypothetical protein J8A68_005010 [[Candida] subhashii]